MKNLLSRKFLCLAIIPALVGLMIPCTSFAEDKAGEDTHVVILLTSDLHGNIWSYSYEDNAETTNNAPCVLLRSGSAGCNGGVRYHKRPGPRTALAAHTDRIPYFKASSSFITPCFCRSSFSYPAQAEGLLFSASMFSSLPFNTYKLTF